MVPTENGRTLVFGYHSRRVVQTAVRCAHGVRVSDETAQMTQFRRLNKGVKKKKKCLKLAYTFS